MFHPLLENVALIKDSDLENKILDLSKKYHMAQRMGQGGVCDQILYILNALREEQSTRNRNMLNKAQSSQNKNLDDLINIR